MQSLMERLSQWRKENPSGGYLLLLLATWCVVQALTRLVMLVSSADAASLGPIDLVKVFGLGFVYDVGAGFFFLFLPALFLLVPQRFLSVRVHRWGLAALTLFLNVFMIFCAVSLYLYWQEFHTNFNFIAVDYLVYTQEMLQQIVQSFPLEIILPAIFAVAAVITWGQAHFLPQSFPWSGRRALALFCVLVVLPVAVACGTSPKWRTHLTENRYNNELAGNGPYEFVHAFFANELDYMAFYQTEDSTVARTRLRQMIAAPNVTFADDETTLRDVKNENALTGRKPNVVIITVESLSASFLGAYGAPHSETPYLDALTKESFTFYNMYATGTRTVRGLEAIALAVPPTPGQSILRRPDNGNLSSLGEAFRQNGYARDFLYGGYGYFDNMNAFFESNGYTIKDRTSIPSEEVIQETVWGVADETLFTQVLRSLDEHAAAGEPAFEMVMTTSNHRPFTFPEGRVDGQQGTRGGAVRYTDWAIHDFLERAKQKPWFDNTVFVIVADHQAGVAGKTALPIDKYRIPCIVYAPGLIPQGRTDRLVSQMDLGPTLLGALGLSYRTSWLGRDLFRTPESEDRAFISTYQSLGLVKGSELVVLTPDKAIAANHIENWATSDYMKEEVPTSLGEEAVSWYQEASDLFKNGLLKNR